MHEVEIDIQDGRTPGLMDDDMFVPDLLKQRSLLRHDSFSLSERDIAGTQARTTRPAVSYVLDGHELRSAVSPDVTRCQADLL